MPGATDQSTSPGTPPYVLVVEDDKDVRTVLSEVLDDEGYVVVAKTNGREALTHLQQHPLPFLILLDLMMPVMNGAEFRAEQVQDPRLNMIPIVVLTAVESGLKNPLFSGCRIIRKPVDLNTLLTQVKPYH
jgi:CheY-like chemotaxis protein